MSATLSVGYVGVEVLDGSVAIQFCNDVWDVRRYLLIAETENIGAAPDFEGPRVLFERFDGVRKSIFSGLETMEFGDASIEFVLSVGAAKAVFDGKRTHRVELGNLDASQPTSEILAIARDFAVRNSVEARQ